MSINMTLKTALQVWEAQYATPEALWPHPSDADIQLANLQDSERRREIGEHIARCAFCADRYREQLRPVTVTTIEGWDVAVRKAAAGIARTFPILFLTEQGHYKIEILQSSTGSDDGLVILSIIDARMAAKYESQELEVCDAQGQSILRAKIKDGQAWQKITKLADIDDQSFLVRPTDKLDPTSEEN